MRKEIYILEGDVEYFAGQPGNPKFDVNWIDKNATTNIFCRECEEEYD